MKSAVETLGPTRVKLTVEVPFAELKPSMDAAVKTIGSQITVPGFRAGKVPRQIIEQRVGRGAILQEAVNSAMPEFYGQACEEAQVRPLGQPEVEITQVPMDEGQDLTFTAEVDVRPEITLPDLDAIAVQVDDLTVSDADVDERVDTLRARFGSLVPIDRAVETGDYVSLDLAAVIDGAEIDAVTGVSYEVGSDNMLPGMDDALLGMSAGETKTFTAPLAGGEHEGADADCTVTVSSVKVRELPELDDAFAQMASEFDTLADLRADLTKGVEQAKRFEQGVAARDKILDYLMDNVDVPLPEGVIEAEVNHHLEGESRLDDDEHRAEVDESTRKALKSQLLLDALAEQESVSVSQEEFIEYLVLQAQQYRMDPNEFAKALDTNGQVPSMVADVARRKALAGLLERVTVTDASGNVVDITALTAGDDDHAGHDHAGHDHDHADHDHAGHDHDESDEDVDASPDADSTTKEA